MKHNISIDSRRVYQYNICIYVAVHVQAIFIVAYCINYVCFCLHIQVRHSQQANEPLLKA